MRIALIDNADSFTYNLALYLEEHPGVELEVYPAAGLTPDALADTDRLVLSPGPGLPGDHPVLIPLIRQFGPNKPILGVCLGLQAICLAFGGRLHNLERVYHGVSARVRVTGAQDPLFVGLEQPLEVGRYHSWVCDPAGFPAELQVTAVDEDGVIMAARHRTWPVTGVQFHPESILTPAGRAIIRNFLEWNPV